MKKFKTVMAHVSGDKFPFVDYKHLYSGILFMAHDGTPMSFVLSTRNFKQEIQLRKVIEHCGGRVERNLKSMTPYTAVLVDDDCLYWVHTGDVFKLSYIETCCNAGKCLNISPFRLNKSSTIVQEGFDYMRIVYFKKFSWTTIPRKYAVKGGKADDEDDDADDDLSTISSGSDSTSNSRSEYKNRDSIKTPKRRIVKHNKHTRISYTRAEKEAILKYIITRNEYSRVKGRAVWQEMEKKGICPNRTWQSMKEHFLKTLSMQFEFFNFITAEQKRNLLMST